MKIRINDSIKCLFFVFKKKGFNKSAILYKYFLERKELRVEQNRTFFAR